MFVLISTLLSVAILAGIYHLSTNANSNMHESISCLPYFAMSLTCLDVIEQSHITPFNPNKTMSEK